METNSNRASWSIGRHSVKSGDEEAGIPLRPQLEPPPPRADFGRDVFDRADTDRDGFISRRELGELLRGGDLADGAIPRHLVRRMYRIADQDNDGRLSYDEFVALTNDPRFSPIFNRYLTKYVNFVIPRRRLESPHDVDTYDAYSDEYSCRPPRLGMIVISIVEFVLFIVDEFNETNSTLFASGPVARTLIYNPTKRYEFWRYLTYMFVHIGKLHLTVNLSVQICIGLPLEMVHGWWRILLIYSAGVIAGSLGTSITDPRVKLAGASGGVYSLITAHIATIILVAPTADVKLTEDRTRLWSVLAVAVISNVVLQNWNEMSLPGFQLLIFLIIVVVDFGTSVYNRYYSSVDEHIGYVAHLAGAFAGFLVGIVVLKNLKLTKRENILWWIAVAVYVILMLIGICWNVFYPEYFPEQF